MPARDKFIDYIKSIRNNYNNSNNSKKKFNNYIKFYRNLRIVGSTSLVLLLLISFLAIYPLVYKENHVLATAGTAIASDTILTLSEYSSSAGLELLVRDTSGTFARSGEGSTAKFTVSTNNFTGYTLSISSNSNDGKLSNRVTDSSTGTEKVIDTLDTIDMIIKESTFNTDPAYINKWGYIPSKYNSESNTNFLPSPTTTATTLDRTTVANNETNESNEYTIGLGARVDYTKPAGTYTNTFILSAIANPTNYTITYKDNSGDDTVNNIPSVTSSSTSETSIALSGIIPTRTGYTFKSWCLGTVSNNGTVCTGTEYNAGGTFGIDQTTTNNTTLYATWTINTYSLTINFSSNNNNNGNASSNGISSVKLCKVSGDCTGDNIIGTISTSGNSVTNLSYNSTYYLYPVFASSSIFSVDNWRNDGSYGTLSASAGSEATSSTSATNPTFTIGLGNGEVTLTSKSNMIAIQDITISSCPSGYPLKVYDVRDYETYYIRKLADGNCWMLDNLNLDLTNADVVNVLSSSNTNASSEALNYLRNGGGSNNNQWANEKLTLSNWTTANSYTSPTVNISGVCDGVINKDYPCTYVGPYNHNQTVAEVTGNSNTVFGKGSGKIGIYYNYCAASAGSYCYNDSGEVSGTDAEYDICPANWRMPTGGSYGEYQNLCTIINGSDCTNGMSMIATSTNSLQYQLSTPLSGSYNSGTAWHQGSYGYFWSSTNYNATTMYYLHSGTYAVWPQDNTNRLSGRSVRCILNTSNYDRLEGGVMTMQEFGALDSTDKAELVSEMTTSEPYTVTDERDGETYTIAKLADGNVWMLDNLNLDLTNSTVVNALTENNTNATTEALGYLKNGGGTNSNQWANTGLTLSNWTTVNSYTAPTVNISGKCDPAINSEYPCTYDGSYTHDTILSTLTPNQSTFGNGSGKIGVYYNYCAASAGSYCYHSNMVDSKANAEYDICPSSWRMPTGGASGEYQTLCTTVNVSDCTNVMSMTATDTVSLQYQLSTPLSGNYNSSIAWSQGTYGVFWSSTYYSAVYMYYLRVGTTTVWPQYYGGRNDGRSVRCLLN